jgi:hypothetical protein
LNIRLNPTLQDRFNPYGLNIRLNPTLQDRFNPYGLYQDLIKKSLVILTAGIRQRDDKIDSLPPYAPRLLAIAL